VRHPVDRAEARHRPDEQPDGAAKDDEREVERLERDGESAGE
jgi:hypothetical protein